MYTPEAYGSIYRLSDTELVSKNEYKDNPLTSLLARKLKTLIKTEEPNLIIGTHPFPMIRLSDTELVSKNEYKDNPLTSLLARKLKTLIKTEEPNLIIGTHPFPMIALCKLKKISNDKKLTENSSNEIEELQKTHLMK